MKQLQSQNEVSRLPGHELKLPELELQFSSEKVQGLRVFSTNVAWMGNIHRFIIPENCEFIPYIFPSQVLDFYGSCQNCYEEMSSQISKILV